ncbi:HpcH/HpaI aldolase family protein [Limimaricola pyoseonensis]|uniref:2-keto-3-deoxy-L-rhamnonate aldolase RhmA n=1 Tax=Limimaricola pyoseonensis TaxID=521013 RepID=A0A1G7HSN0_9RHOB|nr:aldolase/citrate lyase family protein [Limimaricola pyoseonensis]SDF03497.1 2-keto-3-deoxy-L-rhamnonate aldolase RhmA [Limimaricola pyoseonensis]
MSLNAEFRRRLIAREPLLGAFVKTPHPIVVEIMGRSGFDFLVLDAEHAPFDRAAIDTMMIAGRAAGCPLLVRVPSSSPDWLLGVLDAGAAGVMVPHVVSPGQAAELARAMRYGAGGRGFAGTTRAAEYAGRSMREHLAMAGDEVSLICQIEDAEGADRFDEIAAVEGVDALFVGRADLAVSCGRDDFFAPDIAARCAAILGASGAATGLYCAPGETLAPLREAGASLFVVGSDHTLMAGGAGQLRKAFEQL